MPWHRTFNGWVAPIMVIQMKGKVSPERSFVGASAIVRVGCLHFHAVVPLLQ
jgi:hypothetical protein